MCLRTTLVLTSHTALDRGTAAVTNYKYLIHNLLSKQQNSQQEKSVTVWPHITFGLLQLFKGFLVETFTDEEGGHVVAEFVGVLFQL